MGNDGWKQHRLAEICESIDYGFTTSAKEEPVGPKFLRITDIVGGSIDWNTVPYCEIEPSQIANYRLHAGDIVIARTGATTGYSAYLSAVPDAVFASYLVRLKVREPNNARFVAYYLKGRQFWDYMYGVLGDKSAQPNASATTLTQAPISVPPPDVQQRIADVLGKLDDKIELNRRMNRTLEKMAAAIFKSWFIDFDPVHAKADGRDANLPAEIADLFPDSFEDSPLGPIPKGWTAGPLAGIASLQTRTIQPGKQPDVRWEHYSIPAFDEGQQPKLELGETIKSGKYAVPENSVLVSKLNPQFPRIWLPTVTDAAVAICSTEFMPFVPQHADWRPFLYEMMKSQPLQEAIKAHVTGSTGSRQRAKPSEIAELSVLAPPPDAIAAFSQLVAPLHNRLMLNQRQNRRLAGLRDALLPKLMSGELELPVTESKAEEVV